MKLQISELKVIKKNPNLRILRFNTGYTEQREILKRLTKTLSGG